MGTSGAWRKLDADQAGRLYPARVELHWALQAASAAGASLLPRRAGDEHTSFGWSNLLEAFVGRELREGGPAAGLRPRELTLLLLQSDEELAAKPLAGRTLPQAIRWLAAELRDRWGGPLPRPLSRPAYELPPHPVQTGAPFTGDDGASLTVLADWFANAQHLLDEIAAEHEHATEARVWPQRLELSMQILLDPGEPAERARAITVGLTPGDARLRVPYFHVRPSPYPAQQTTLPALPDGGRWNLEGWTGALLPATALDEDPAEQREQAQFFLQASIGACKALLRR